MQNSVEQPPDILRLVSQACSSWQGMHNMIERGTITSASTHSKTKADHAGKRQRTRRIDTVHAPPHRSGLALCVKVNLYHCSMLRLPAWCAWLYVYLQAV
jgi:hypothetical protein